MKACLKKTNESPKLYLEEKGRYNMDIKTLKIYYHFEQTEEVTGKSDGFIEKLEELEGLAKRLQNVVHEEAEKSKGELIDQITESIDEHVNYSQLYYDAAKTSMENASKKYNTLINKIKAHHMTVHYEVIEMNQS